MAAWRCVCAGHRPARRWRTLSCQQAARSSSSSPRQFESHGAKKRFALRWTGWESGEIAGKSRPPANKRAKRNQNVRNGCKASVHATHLRRDPRSLCRGRAPRFNWRTLVRSDLVADAWDRESALPGMTVGGLTRHSGQPAGVCRGLPRDARSSGRATAQPGRTLRSRRLARSAGRRPGEHLHPRRVQPARLRRARRLRRRTRPFARAARLGDRCSRADDVCAMAELRAAHRRLPRRAG